MGTHSTSVGHIDVIQHLPHHFDCSMELILNFLLLVNDMRAFNRLTDEQQLTKLLKIKMPIDNNNNHKYHD